MALFLEIKGYTIIAFISSPYAWVVRVGRVRALPRESWKARARAPQTGPNISESAPAVTRADRTL